MDTGEIIEQRKCDIRPDDSKEQLEEKVKNWNMSYIQVLLLKL